MGFRCERGRRRVRDFARALASSSNGRVARARVRPRNRKPRPSSSRHARRGDARTRVDRSAVARSAFHLRNRARVWVAERARVASDHHGRGVWNLRALCAPARRVACGNAPSCSIAGFGVGATFFTLRPQMFSILGFAILPRCCCWVRRRSVDGSAKRDVAKTEALEANVGGSSRCSRSGRIFTAS